MTDLSTEAEKSPKRRGPHTALSEHEILTRREVWVEVFEGLWGKIGWELQKCKDEIDIVSALSPLKDVHFIREYATVFFLESKEPVTVDKVRNVRAELRQVERRYQDAASAKQHALDRLGRINEATSDVLQNTQWEIERARNECKNDVASQSKSLQDLSLLKGDLESKLRSLEAGFARKEILSFLKSKRYELTPLKLANAVAGLPYMGWRQSMRRSIEHPSMSANGLDYQIFKAIFFIATNAKRSSENSFVEKFRETIPKLPRRHGVARDELARQWFFLERAIRCAFRSKSRSKAFPFEIAKHYFRNMRSRSQSDRILAQQRKLSLLTRK